MRKLIWGCAASGVLAVCSAFGGAHYAVHHPQSVVGRAMFGASHIAAYASLYSGFAPVLARFDSVYGLHDNEVAVDVEGVPADPTPEAGEEAIAGPIDAPKDAAPIVIPEFEAPVKTGLPVGGDLVDLPSSKELTAPATMPPVGDDEESELPMPKEAVEVEHQSWLWMLTKWFRGGDECQRETTVLKHTEVEAIEEQKTFIDPPECREDRDYHRQYPGCPHPGGRPHGCTGAAPVALPVVPVKEPGGEEASEEGARSAALKAIRRLRSRTKVPEEAGAACPGVDTMEYRQSDRPLYNYGPRPL